MPAREIGQPVTLFQGVRMVSRVLTRIVLQGKMSWFASSRGSLSPPVNL